MHGVLFKKKCNETVVLNYKHEGFPFVHAKKVTFKFTVKIIVIKFI